MAETNDIKPKLGVSACLLGQAVRYDGADKREALIVEQLGKEFDLIAFCPEVAIGLGVPRETIALVGELSNPRAIGTQTAGHDVTAALKNYARSLQRESDLLAGYIVKARSPSCGWQSVNVFAGVNENSIGVGNGIFIDELHKRHPLLPIIDEEQLRVDASRHHFYEQVFALARWRDIARTGWNKHKLMQFHSQYKYLLMSRKETYYRQLGQFVANAPATDCQTQSSIYLTRLMAALRENATRDRHVNVLQHLLGYFKKQLNTQQKAEALAAIESFRAGAVPVSEPISVLKDYLRTFPNAYLAQQAYLFPYPEGL